MATEFDFDRRIGGELRSRGASDPLGRARSPADLVLGALAARQHGVVSRAQLSRLDLSDKVVDKRIQTGRLHPIHRGVYAVGHPLLSREGRWLAAVLAGGEDSVLSHRSAAALWGLLGEGGRRPEITSPTPAPSRPLLSVHSSTLLPVDEITKRRGIPVTTVSRTLLDLAAAVSYPRFAHAVDIAEARSLGDSVSLAALVCRYPGRRGIRAVRRVIVEGRIGFDLTRGELELRFREFLTGSGLPRPEVNTPLLAGGVPIEADFLWRDARLIVELDGRRYHDTAVAFERDRVRDRALVADGWRVMRVTWRQLHAEPEALARDLAHVLRPRSRAEFEVNRQIEG